MEIKNNPRILISRTDNLGDVVLALPMASIIKKAIPNAYIMFLGKPYTEEIIRMSRCVDQFVDWEMIKNQTPKEQIQSFRDLKADYIVHTFPQRHIARLAKIAGIPNRIGTTGRIYHWSTCNKLVRFSRRRSNLHEAQLNLKLLKPFGIKHSFSLPGIIENYQLTPPDDLSKECRNMLNSGKFNLILHPKSKGSAREWGMNNYNELIKILPEDTFKIFISGTANDTSVIQNEIISVHPNVTDISGKLSLKEFISFIANADGLIACSTGPLHIAAALNKIAVGIYPPIRPMHPGRWAPLGHKATYLVAEKNCSQCRKSISCKCIEEITPENVKSKLMQFIKRAN